MLPEADRLEPQMRTPKSQRRGPGGVGGGASGTEADDWALEGLGWEEGRDGDLHLACHVFRDPLPSGPKSLRES